MIKINKDLRPSDLNNKLKKLWKLSEEKISLIEKNYDASKGSPVFTVNGNYTTGDGRNGPRDFNTALLFCSLMLRERNHFLNWGEGKPLN